jgi:hypothetical protein
LLVLRRVSYKMGSVVGTAANGVGTLIGNAFAAPFRAVFSASCE